MPTLLLEVGTEEMPANAVPGAMEQLLRGVPAALEEARLGASQVRVLATPRRLAVLAKDVPLRQPDVEREVRGPSWKAAFGPDGAPTNAAQGFARKLGIGVEHLQKLETPQGDYVVARVLEQGKPAVEALGPVLEACLKGLTFPKVMRWGSGGSRFVRPVRWILCLLDDQVVPMEFAGVPSGNSTRGHRYLAPAEFAVRHAEEYEATLRQIWVMADPDERRRSIQAQADALASEVGGRVPWDDELLLENVHLVEWPTCLLGRFEERFLALPRPVLVTAMKKHQRFFPVETPDGRLLPCFLSVRNGGTDHLDKVRAGNEAVLTARFEDAQHFYEHDRVVPLSDMAERLGRLLFQEKLGSMAHKRDRLMRLAAELASVQGLPAETMALARRAAYLCKADLTSEMVIELPSLQGIMGREYALLQGENAAVADAIAEHYKPRNAADTTAHTVLGKILAVADRMDTLVGYAGLGITPTGSADPFGLRRAAQGVVDTLTEECLYPSLPAMERMAAEAYREVNGLDLPFDELASALQSLFDQRVAASLEEMGIRYDLRDAALSAGEAGRFVVRSTILRARVLQEVSGEESFVPTVQAGARVANILGDERMGIRSPSEAARDTAPLGPASYRRGFEERLTWVREGLLREDAERTLLETARTMVEPISEAAGNWDYEAVYRLLQEMEPPVSRFFDDVLVMTEEADLRENRLALLGLVSSLYRTLADFRKVVIP